MNLWVGIDPGLSGALAIISTSGETSSAVVFDCPVFSERAGGKRDYDIVGMEALLAKANRASQITVALEWPSWAGLKGKLAAASIARSCSIWETLLTVEALAYNRVVPHVWKRKMGLIGKGKDASRALAMRLWPDLRDQLQRKKDDGRAEALLLAEYLRRGN
jgi:crossover junction endodeoxyribonuclease RuvC